MYMHRMNRRIEKKRGGKGKGKGKEGKEKEEEGTSLVFPPMTSSRFLFPSDNEDAALLLLWKNEPASRISEPCLLHLAMSEITAVGTRYQIVINETALNCDGTAPRIINGCLRPFVKNYSVTEVAQPSEGKS
ncbi:hypothetical protein MRB53_024087 [Persea americana]|uniref:Uncharacterized protein n=1 Tax=Persea americana TaxID=3435 RepID=A0ACC2LCK5_PERAE|nr:hypothetical protein MRB53_024087 [Persea americana]